MTNLCRFYDLLIKCVSWGSGYRSQLVSKTARCGHPDEVCGDILVLRHRSRPVQMQRLSAIVRLAYRVHGAHQTVSQNAAAH